MPMVEVEPDDATLLARSLRDPEAFTALFEQHYDPISAYLRRRVGGETADELAAETFLRAFAARGRYDAQLGSARGWLFGIATNLARQHRRTEERRLRAYARSCFAQTEPDTADVDARADARTLRGALADALASLAEGDRDVLLLHSWADLSHDEIAGALGIPAGTVRSRLSRARRLVRERIGASGEEPVDRPAANGVAP